MSDKRIAVPGEGSDPRDPKKTQGRLPDLSRLIYNDTFVLIISLIAAVLVWTFVAFKPDERATVTVHGVPVSFDTSSGLLERLNLYPTMEDGSVMTDAKVDVEINGNRAVIGSVKPEDLLVSAAFGSVRGTGEYRITFEVSDSQNRDLEIKGTKPDSMTVQLENRTEKTLEVELSLGGDASIPEGFMMDKEIIEPREITVSGPQSLVDKITSCEAALSLTEPLTESVSREIALDLCDADGETIASSYLKKSSETAMVTLPVLKKKTVPTTVEYTNVPDGFDVNSLWYEINPREIEIAGPAETVDAISEVRLGYVNIASFKPDIPRSYPINLPADCKSVDNTQEAVVTFDSQDYGTRTFNVSELRLVNQPEEYDVTVSTKIIYDVEITGPLDELETVDPGDLVAEIDMRKTDVRIGQSTVTANILVTSNSTCWASGGTYNAVITVRSK